MNKIMSLKECGEKYGSFERDGREYVLLQNAYLALDGYVASAVCIQDEEHDGIIPCYMASWEITGNDDDESYNADWDNPISVVECGDYNVWAGLIY